MARELKHTPGPWRIGNLESYDAYTGKPYRNVWNAAKECIARAIENGDVDANARLIAQSPALLSLLIDYESWEADLIMSNEAWGKDGMNSLPTFTQELLDRFLELQQRRNEIIKAITG